MGLSWLFRQWGKLNKGDLISLHYCFQDPLVRTDHGPRGCKLALSSVGETERRGSDIPALLFSGLIGQHRSWTKRPRSSLACWLFSRVQSQCPAGCCPHCLHSWCPGVVNDHPCRTYQLLYPCHGCLNRAWF